MSELFNAAAGHGQDWGMDKPSQEMDNLSSAHDHGRAVIETRTRVIVRGAIEYKSHNVTIYHRPHAMRNAYQIKADDWA